MDLRVCVIGLGYIGLPTASLLATKGFRVLGVDINPDVVSKINAGGIHIVEPGLDILVKSAIHSENLRASLTPDCADVFIIAVPTPFDEHKQPDVAYIAAAANAIAPHLKNDDLIILESTSPVGTTQKIQSQLLKLRPDLTALSFAYCPERVIPGKVLQELIENDRIVGGLDAQSTQRAVDFYKSFVGGKVLETTARVAEMCKLTENAFRDVNIAFANELSMICEALKMDVWELIRLANHHPRVHILQPGPGVGGHCIAVDPWFIVSQTPEHAKLIKTAREVNDAKPDWVIQKIKHAAKKFVKPVIACLGLSFKANIGDLRQSPAKYIVEKLIQDQVGEILVCEPHLEKSDYFQLTTLSDAIERADMVVILVDHLDFKKLSMVDLSEKIVIDTKGILLSHKMAATNVEFIHA
ncbi:MAG: UDP-N-acetyl-D-mannosamine dehydrogenase [Gammaproteobacteria bacterium CG_4_10_14_0_8_um_filter_38_16]|nr:MAG: UDP-N-acetyl-D-mannosamine dehydrogenase [Gammaproteobacteria bacterium CG_4_10_14_0_8_um_filter_38_16]PJA02787.1 MAG: UDP-N-acetyl-D-mannosamine dehydrogenase [Gammaproteobacteria bacterium CG_4_10_14_0_2_um_filter_38_22]PJB10722.1 MAG: UDP-N-acetyl-D-mannosamine dehydrogenase [Gammaproteobacteria bacterium CG_4_9_14_3_um_filter_38_9]